MSASRSQGDHPRRHRHDLKAAATSARRLFLSMISLEMLVAGRSEFSVSKFSLLAERPRIEGNAGLPDGVSRVLRGNTQTVFLELAIGRLSSSHQHFPSNSACRRVLAPKGAFSSLPA